MFRKIRERISLNAIKNPRGVVLFIIIVFNALILFLNSFIIFTLLERNADGVGFWTVLYYTIGMILDAGMIENIVDLTEADLILVTVCIITIIIGSITFTGAVIGYVTNYISGFVDSANMNSRRLLASDHTVILNWNSRASEIINDMLYTQRKETIVVMVNDDAERIRSEINERLYLTLKAEKKLKIKLDVIVKEGSTYSIKMLQDISLERAKTIIILGEDDTASNPSEAEEKEKRSGNANTVKTLVQVSQITSSEESSDNQRIIVETDDPWTGKLVDKIISHKEVLDKCNIVPVSVNCILGQLFSQFCIFPELNMVYSNLFSNKGAEFFCVPGEEIKKTGDEEEDIRSILASNENIVPLASLESKTGPMFYYMALEEKDFYDNGNGPDEKSDTLNVKIRPNYGRQKKNIIILGHNSKIRDIMNGFNSFSNEWKTEDGSEILNILVIDDEKSLEQNGYYKEYRYINRCIATEIYDIETIKNEIEDFVDTYDEDTSILILSDDCVDEKDIDSYALTSLIYVHDIITDKLKENPDFDKEKIDVIVEILNPKNYDVLSNYQVNNIVISNRYISKMVTQIGEKIELYEFYNDILKYDDESEGRENFDSREIYIRQVRDFLEEIPPKCLAYDLIRAIYDASPKGNKSVLLGITKPGGVVDLFGRDQRTHMVELGPKDKLIIYSKH